MLEYIGIKTRPKAESSYTKNIWRYRNRRRSSPAASFWTSIGKARSLPAAAPGMSLRSCPPGERSYNRPVRSDGYSDKNNSCGMGRRDSNLPLYPGPRHPGCMYSKRIWSTSSQSADSD